MNPSEAYKTAGFQHNKKKQPHLCNCLKFNYLTCDPVGMVLVRRTAHSLFLRHGRSYMSIAECARLRLPFSCRAFQSLSKLRSCPLRYEKRLTRVRRILLFYVIRLGFEPKTHSLEGCCSIQLSYRTGL